MERKVRDSCGKSVAKGDPAGERRGGSRTARGKRVPGVEIIHILPFGGVLASRNVVLSFIPIRFHII
ncbi:hypothetical protein ACQKMY_08405 [Peribacillus frigoritolerans]|uniref:hypothetical protein n=1 Tax=Peribacillus frigoritolerans TaxID=450367 RepID=UPI003D0873DD